MEFLYITRRYKETQMSKYSKDNLGRRLFSAPILLMGLSGVVAGCAGNAAQDRYRFDVVNQPVPIGAHSPITVRMFDTSTGRPVDGATISAVRLSKRMPSTVPPGKGARLSRSLSDQARFVGPAGAGQYGLIGDVSMPGMWTLDLAASVPGEASSVAGSTKFVVARERQDP
jgi:hypothetical protein